MAKQDRVGDFIQQAEQAQVGLVRELWAWLRHNKKWWLSPVVVILLFVSFFGFSLRYCYCPVYLHTFLTSCEDVAKLIHFHVYVVCESPLRDSQLGTVYSKRLLMTEPNNVPMHPLSREFDGR